VRINEIEVIFLSLLKPGNRNLVEKLSDVFKLKTIR
jgi:hypothetical protein